MTIARAFWTRSPIGRQIVFLSGVALIVGACASASGASIGTTAASTTVPGLPTAPAGALTVAPAGGPVGVLGSAGSGLIDSGTASSGQAIAYPYPGYPGTPGLAPDHTIVVTGFGQAPMAADQSDRASAQQAALKVALADAKSQADVVASATSVTIEGVLSVSVSTSQGYCCPVPMVVSGAPTGPAVGGTVVPMPVQPPIAPTAELDVTVTVAYRIG